MDLNLSNKVIELLDTVKIAIDHLKTQIDQLRVEEAIVMLLDINDSLDSINEVKELDRFANEILVIKRTILKEMIAIDKKEFENALYLISYQLNPQFLILKIKIEGHISNQLS